MDKINSDAVPLPKEEEKNLIKDIVILPRNFTKRIPIAAGPKITYKGIFGACFS